jgi:hypothetical protein
MKFYSLSLTPESKHIGSALNKPKSYQKMRETNRALKKGTLRICESWTVIRQASTFTSF